MIATDLISIIIADHKLRLKEPKVQLHRSDKSIPNFEIVAITGVRRCGKSTLLRSIGHALLKQKKEVLYIGFEDPRLEDLTADQLERFYTEWVLTHNKQGVILLDEVQNIKNWESWLNYFVEHKKHRVIVTGSNAKMLSSELATHLTGRHFEMHQTPLSFSELVQNNHKNTDFTKLNSPKIRALAAVYKSYCQFGGFPKVIVESNIELLQEYYRDIILKDVVVRKNIRKPNEIIALARKLATDNGTLFNHSKTAVMLGIKKPSTVAKYCNYICDCYLYKQLKQFSWSVKKQERSLVKYYCVDTVMARMNGFNFSPDKGKELESQVLIELCKREGEVYYWTSKKGYGVDFIVLRPGSKFAMT